MGMIGRGNSANATTVAPDSCRVLMRLLLGFEQPVRRAAMSMNGNSRIICLTLLIVDRVSSVFHASYSFIVVLHTHPPELCFNNGNQVFPNGD